MKNQVQEIGVRKWFGSDFILLQDEIIAGISGILSEYGNFILSGGVFTYAVDIANITDGFAYLKASDGTNGQICRITETNISESPTIYLVQGVKTKTDVAAYGRDYEDTNNKNIIHEYYAKIETSVPAHSNYITCTVANTNTFRHAIQSANFRFVTDTDKTNWNAKLAASAYTAADVLAKLLTVDTDTAGINATTLKSVTPAAYALEYLPLATQFAYATKLLTDLKTVDGSESGLDADTLDGLQSGAFQIVADCVSTNTANKVVKRDLSGDFAAGTITVTDIIIA